MASFSSSSRRYDIFPSFNGEDVRKGFLSHLLKEFERESINTFLDNGIERSRPISRELLSAIREAKIAIVIFTKSYASSTWCLDELVEIHKCSKELNQMVIPVFYDVDPADVRKQTGEFGESFLKTCKGKTDDEIQSWIQALTDVANLAGEHLEDWLTEDMVEEIADYVLDKLISPSDGFGDLVGIEAHIEAMESILCLESEEVRMVGIWGQSGIGKSTLARALFTHLSPKFPFYAFLTYKSPDHDVFGMKSFWERRLLVETFGNNRDHFLMVEHMFKDKQVLIVLDDVDNLEYLETLAGKTEWFGPGSRIIVITQDTHILKSHKIDLLYEVKIPPQDSALKIFCRSAFVQDSPPEDFKELAHEVVRLAGGLPLGLRVLGHSLKGRAKEEWMDLLSGLKNGLKGDIMKTLSVGYDRLHEKEQDLFLWIACLFNGESVKSINNFFGDGNSGLQRLAEKSLIRIARNGKIVEMHNLLEKLGREIVCAESKDNPGKRRFLTDAKEIEDVLANQTGSENVLGISVDALASIDKKSFKGMFNLQFLYINDFSNTLSLPNGAVYLPPNLKWLDWNFCPLKCLPPNLKWLDWNYCQLKCLPSNFKAEFLVELRMRYSDLKKLWGGTQQLGNLKTIIMSDSKYLEDIPDLSKAINLERVEFSHCYKLKRFPDLSKSINLNRVNFSKCYSIESFTSPLNWESLEYLNLKQCNSFKNFPQIRMESLPHGIEIEVYDCLWNKNLPGLDYIDCLRSCYPLFLPEHLVSLSVRGTTMEKLWEGVQGNKIQAGIKKEHLSKFQRFINKGEWKIIEDFGVTKSVGQYRSTSHQYRINFLYTTTIASSPQISDEIWLELVPFNNIIDGTQDQSKLVDVMGQLVNVGKIQSIQAQGKPTNKIDFQLRDIDDNRLPCTLWGKFAEQINQISQESIATIVVCLIRWGKIGTYREIQSVSNAFDASEVLVNPNLSEVVEFKRRLPSDGLTLSILDPKPKINSLISEEEFANEFPKRTIAEFVSSKEVEKVITICSILAIDTDWSWYYFSCRKCNKKVTKSKNINQVEKHLFWCDTCGKDVISIVPRYWLHLIIKDNTGESKIMLFDHVGQQIIGHSVSELLDGSYVEIEDPEALPAAIKSIVGKTYQFVICVEKDNINKTKDVFKVAKVLSSIDDNESASNNESDFGLDKSSFSSEQVLLNDNSEKSDTIMSIVSTPMTKRKKDVPDQSSSSKKHCSTEKKIDIIDVSDNIQESDDDNLLKKKKDAAKNQVTKANEQKNIVLKKVKVEKI